MSLFQENLQSLTLFLQQNKSCNSLILSHCGLQNLALQYLAKGLRSNTTLVSLNLGNNNFIDVSGIKSFTDALLKPKVQLKLSFIDL